MDINKYLEGVIKLEDISEINNPKCHYLPHRAVVKESSTIKLRPVFDASAKDKKCVSLNDFLEKGSNLIELIPTTSFSSFHAKQFREKEVWSPLKVTNFLLAVHPVLSWTTSAQRAHVIVPRQEV
ncbi:hypothetical protein AVEN_262638-1 [Araneus ventricosus]|uniref:Uncharacterized protein n=1 Tax=Araneus ventricosus TaxID=182803 RepID=A0A4Y2NZA3_ARAVE|nr:hypothetical protein AVEN_262638-1 [Araneus ventricosus]